MNCSECGLPLAVGAKYLAVFLECGENIRIEVSCRHITPQKLDTAIAILNGQDCAQKFFTRWMHELECDH